MDLTDQLAAKLLAQSVQQLGLALNEVLCRDPDRDTIKGLIAGARDAICEFEDAYFLGE